MNRQYPLYSKTEPPAGLSSHFTPEVFEKSQKYGKDKAKLAFVAGLYKQCIESALLHYGFYAWAWGVAGCALAKFGYSADYEANPWLLCRVKRVLTICTFPPQRFPNLTYSSR